MKKKIYNVPLSLKEQKIIEIDGIEYFTFKGYASTFGNIDRDGDIIAPGAFKSFLKEHSPALLWQHKLSEPVGVFYIVKEVTEGLYVEGRMPLSDSLVKGRVVPQMRAGSVRTMSIGFTVDGYEYDKENNIYTFTKVKLWEISLVTIPANPKAVVTDMKTFENIINNALSELEIDDNKKKSIKDNLYKSYEDVVSEDLEIENPEKLNSLKEITSFLKKFGISNKKCNIIISKIKSFVRDEQDLENTLSNLEQEATDEDVAEFFECLSDVIKNLKTEE